MVFAERLKDLREALGLTRQQLADSTGLSVHTILSYEKGRREPNSKAMASLERFFNVSGEYLRGEVDRVTFLSKSEAVQEGLDQLIMIFGNFQEEFGTSAQDEQLLAVSVLEAVVDLLSRHVLHAGHPLDFTVQEIVEPISAVFALNPQGRGELSKRAVELTELARYQA